MILREKDEREHLPGLSWESAENAEAFFILPLRLSQPVIEKIRQTPVFADDTFFKKWLCRYRFKDTQGNTESIIHKTGIVGILYET